MKTNTMGLSILAGGLAFVGSANAVDLIVNGSFEQGVGEGWIGYFQTYNYSAAYYAGPAVPASENPGDNYSWRHGVANLDYSGPLIQNVNLLNGASQADIDAGRGTAVFSAWMASYTENPERPMVTVQFFDSGSAALGSTIALDRTSGANFVVFADGVTTFDRTTHEHYWAKYSRNIAIPPGARSARVGVTRSPNAGLSGNPDTYTDLVKLDVSAVAYVPPSIDGAQPNGSNVRPDAVINISLLDGSTQVNTNTIQLQVDGALVAPAITRTGGSTTIQYDPPGLLPPASAHTYRLTFSDTSAIPVSQTNDFNFTVSSYYNILLPAPLYFENFDSTAEGSLPTGWTEFSLSDLPDPTCDLSGNGNSSLQDLNSACYGKWTTVNSARFQNAMLTYNAHTPETDYQRVLTPTLNVVNGAVLDQLAHTNIAFGDAGYRDGNSQIVYLYSKDFDLTGQDHVYLALHVLWEQNQDSIGAIEYSTDEGATWLPIVYYLTPSDILRDGNGNIDAVATFSTVRIGGFEGQATYFDSVSQQNVGGYYGAFIGVDSNRWSTLAPYIQGRGDDNPADGKRVEVFRLPAADNQSKVRLRFSHAGTDSWYFGIDDVGLYRLTSVAPPVISVTPTNATDYVGNHILLSSSINGIGPFTFQWQHNGADISQETNATLVISAPDKTAGGTYTLRVSYPGGFASASATVTILDPSGAFVTGQWDFDNFDLAATVGHDLEFYDNYSAFNSDLTTSDFYGLPDINGEAVAMMHFPGEGGQPMNGYIMRHGISANGGGAKVNQYTLIMDILYQSDVHNTERALLQTNPTNIDNRDIAIGANNGIGVSGGFEGSFLPDVWQRITFAVDLAGPGPHPIMAKYINGLKVGQQALTEGIDGRWSLYPAEDPASPWSLLFADDNTEGRPGFVSSIQIRKGRLSDAEIARLGGPSPGKIPGAIRVLRNEDQLVINWSGRVPLQSATSLSGPWSDVVGATSPYVTPGPVVGNKFYRPKL